MILKTGFNQQHFEGKSVDVDKVKAIVDVEQGSTISCVDNGDPCVSKSTNGPNYTICTIPAGKVAILFGVKDGVGYIKVSITDVVYINGTKITSSNQQSTAIDVGKVYVVENTGSSAVTLSTYSAGGGQFVVLGPV